MVLKPSEIRDLSDDELRQKRDSLRQEIFKLRFEIEAGRIEKPHRISQARKELARILTIMNEKKRKSA